MRLQTSKTKNAESFYIVESIYVDGKRSNKVVKKLGTLQQIKALIGPDKDPYEWGREQAAEMTAKQAEDNESINIEIPVSQRLEKDAQNTFPIGYLFLQKVYHELGIPGICSEITSRHKFEYDLNSILSRLVYSRALFPSSKKHTYETCKSFLEKPEFELHQIYRALEVLSKESDFIQAQLYKNSKDVINRNDSVLYYDCTNYYFEIEKEDEFRKYGFSKEHRPNPIVQMGLFMDGNGIPLAFNINPGNKNEQVTLKPTEKSIIKDFELSDFIVCTDAGLSSADNRMFNSIQNRSFVTTQSIKMLKGFLKDWALNPEGFRLGNGKEEYNIQEIDKDVHFHDIFWKEQWINEGGLEQRLIVTYSPKYAKYTSELRTRHVEKAENLIANKSSSLSSRGGSDVRKYIDAISATDNGEIAEKTIYSINEAAITEEEKYDGFYATCTNLEDDAKDILKIIRGRWEIEECFRIMKTEFEARPVYLSREDRIKAHFLTCFMALLLYRIIEHRVQEKDEHVTTAKLLDTMQQMDVMRIRDIYFPTYTRTDVTDILHEISGFQTDSSAITAKKMRKILKKSKEA